MSKNLQHHPTKIEKDDSIQTETSGEDIYVGSIVALNSDPSKQGAGVEIHGLNADAVKVMAEELSQKGFEKEKQLDCYRKVRD
jgi:hypothetical protein